MADSLKLQVMKRLTALIETVSVDDGYSIDLAGRVFRGRNLFGKDTPTTTITITESPRPGPPVFAGEGNARLDDWLILVNGWTRDDPTNPTDPLYPILDDIERVLSRIVKTNKVGDGMYPEDYRLGGLIAGLEMGVSIVRPADEVSSKAFFYLPLRVSLARQVG